MNSVSCYVAAALSLVGAVVAHAEAPPGLTPESVKAALLQLEVVWDLMSRRAGACLSLDSAFYPT
jgi:hypothetical protein